MATYTDLQTSPLNSRLLHDPTGAMLITRGTNGPDTYTLLPSGDPVNQLPIGSWIMITDPSPIMEAHIPKDRRIGGYLDTDPSNWDVTTGITSLATFLSGLVTWDASYDVLPS